jgi:sulfur relay (sulfurtransferase) DsrF/TusC family protein
MFTEHLLFIGDGSYPNAEHEVIDAITLPDFINF